MRYFIGKNGRQLGPFGGQEIRERLAAGELDYEDLVWREGLPGWAPLRTEFPPLETPPMPPPGLVTAPAFGGPPPLSPASPTATRSTPTQPVAGGKKGFVLGLVNLVTWIIPLVGLPLAIWGLVASIQDARRGAGGKAVAGIVLNSVALLLVVINAAIGAYLGATGQHPLLR